MSVLADIRAGLAENLQAGVSGAQISAYLLANPTTPCLWVTVAQDIVVEYHQTMQDGAETWHLLVQGYVSGVADIGAQKQLDEWIAVTGTNSVKAAIEQDKTLDGTCDDVLVRECRAYTKYVLPSGAEVLGAEWDVEVLT